MQDKSNTLHGYILKPNFVEIHCAQWLIVSERRKFGLEVSALACEPADCGGRLDRFGLEGDDPIGIASGRRPLTGWISIGVEVRFFGTRSSNQFHSPRARWIEISASCPRR
jgi:hypothetical protein